MPNPHSVCPKPPPLAAFLLALRAWYRAWVQMREARYRYLEAILDGTLDPTDASVGHSGATGRSDDQRNLEKQDGAP